MKHSILSVFVFISLIFSAQISIAQHQPLPLKTMSPKTDLRRITFLDLDKDGDPDVLRTYINDTIPVQWIDDDDDMKFTELQGDRDNDCMMIDRNSDSKYGYEYDLILDYVDENDDGKADLQIIADNAGLSDKGWTPGHFMISNDTDHDGVFNYIDWNTLQLEPWDRDGRSSFHQDYKGQTMFLKIHTSVFNMADPRLNWENPFLFYDTDGDGLTEMAIRFADQPKINSSDKFTVKLSGKITDVRMSLDLDNDNAPGNEFDFDMSLRWSGPGFDYMRYKHHYSKLRGLPEADSFFYDSRWRQISELIYVDHKNAYQEILKGSWNQCWLVFDEDDDCERWERVEFYEPADMFISGSRKGGLDNNPQADVSGDRGEWDSDFSGKSNLYIGSFDGRIHLLGAEWGGWRIDQSARYYQGWQGWRNGADSIPNNGINEEPSVFASVKYIDTDQNGFFDTQLFDLDGDRYYEDIISLKELGINDSCKIIHTKTLSYPLYRRLFKDVAFEMWEKAKKALDAGAKWHIPITDFSIWLHPVSINQKYNYGFWITFLIYNRMLVIAKEQNNDKLIKQVKYAYATGLWNLLDHF